MENINKEMVLERVKNSIQTNHLGTTERDFDDIEQSEVTDSFISENKMITGKGKIDDYLLPVKKIEVEQSNVQPLFLATSDHHLQKPFIEANTTEVTGEHLQRECIIPVFSKDNERTIAHQEFIEVIINAVQQVFPDQSFSQPEIRVSHQIKGRIPSAIHKNAKELLEHEKTIYYERMAFIVKIPGIKDVINGNEGINTGVSYRTSVCTVNREVKIIPTFTKARKEEDSSTEL